MSEVSASRAIRLAVDPRATPSRARACRRAPAPRGGRCAGSVRWWRSAPRQVAHVDASVPPGRIEW